jgi:hypothetical protein
MVMPNIDVKLSTPFFILGASIALSYFSHVGWWSFTGLVFFFGLLTESKPLSIFWFIASLVLLVISILRMGWVYF